MSIDHHYMLSSGKSLTIDLSNMISNIKCYHDNLNPTIKDNWNKLATFLDILYGKAERARTFIGWNGKKLTIDGRTRAIKVHQNH